MKRTLFNTPIITPVIRVASRATLTIFGWKAVGEKYSREKKYVGVAAPHTSNWDFPIFLLTAFAIGIDAHWMGKHTLFRFPFGGLMTWLGGIPVNRKVRGDMVSKATRMFRENTTFAIGISPEGTRKPVERWHTGFWHIAKNANVPIFIAFIDYKKKQCGIDHMFRPSDEVDADMEKIKKFYANCAARHPHNFKT